MPLEINEIGVHLAVGGATSEQRGKEPENGCCEASGLSPSQTDALVERTVREVLRRLQALGAR
ncbi:DUF5908 family protein [Azospirillum sp. sgz302134]